MPLQEKSKCTMTIEAIFAQSHCWLHNVAHCVSHNASFGSGSSVLPVLNRLGFEISCDFAKCYLLYTNNT